MSSIDYSLFEREETSLDDLASEEYDVFISSYNSSLRVTNVFDEIVAASKHWLVHPEYEFSADEVPTTGECFFGVDESEIDFWIRFFDHLEVKDSLSKSRVAIDITGMMRGHIVALPLVLLYRDLDRVTLLYSDPRNYVSGIETRFTVGSVARVNQIPGFEGMHTTSTHTSDMLIIGAGYDDSLIRAVAESKGSADHYVLVGLPSLQPHMYQESKYRVQKASESIQHFRPRSFLYAPASNPFMTAQVLSSHIEKLRILKQDLNVYLSPVGSKAQVLGFSWFYLSELVGTASSVIFPYAPRYEKETSTGISRIHKYQLDLVWLRTRQPSL